MEAARPVSDQKSPCAISGGQSQVTGSSSRGPGDRFTVESACRIRGCRQGDAAAGVRMPQELGSEIHSATGAEVKPFPSRDEIPSKIVGTILPLARLAVRDHVVAAGLGQDDP